ncbi:MAG TPA: 4-hydroxy-tetrahydrodipicolinate reductase [Fimbriimonadaceae bacterium]|nr:4-hydroxy-tetrahydrodipicolinate reductase [Armatimonadota bacterium]HRI74139.1 4-hydroxy-tetrahydrodipicolinate reductase [Fimbriimonadaceae bacterium]
MSESPQPTPIRVTVVGALGRMGQESVRALSSDSRFEVVGAVDRSGAGQTLASVLQIPSEVVVTDKLSECLDQHPADVLLDFTHFSSAPDHAMRAMKRGLAVVIGTSGLRQPDVRTLVQTCQETGQPCLLVPNFAIGAVLMMRFAEMAAAYFPHAEVIERHGHHKLDAPSGTGRHTATLISQHRAETPREPQGAVEAVAGARGAKVDMVPVHSLRLPGSVAHQEVLFGGPGELLTIKHDSYDRASFMGGVKLACAQVRSLSGFVTGLDAVLF